jgi:hypothetical protein
VEQLLAFKPGDFIELDLEPMIQAKVDGVPVFDCHYGTSQRPLRDQDRTNADRLQPGWIGADHEPDDARRMSEEDRMAAEWAAALAESKRRSDVASEVTDARRRVVAPARSPTSRRPARHRPATTST